MKVTEKTVSQTLRNMGVAVNNYGFTYLKHAVLMVSEDESYLHSITKRLYPEIAKKCDTTPQRVERAIRHAVEMVFSYGNPSIQELGLPHFSNGKMKNGEFIGAVCECLKYREEV
jgi:two-component system response regulator (stage 0 sporulation protein A)